MKFLILSLVFIAQDKPKAQFPTKATVTVSKVHIDTTCVEHSGYSDGYDSYICVSGKWVVDLEAREGSRKEATHRHDLYWALRTRVLAEQEMEEVRNYGTTLITEPMRAYTENAVNAELNAAYLQQFTLRQVAARGCR